MNFRRRPSGGERGETLIELIVAMAILGVAGVAIMTGLMISVTSSDQQRQEATGGTYVRSWAEKIQNSVDSNAGYPSCATAEATYKAIGDAMIAADPALSGFTASLETSSSQLQKVMSWAGTSWGSCAAGGVQRVLLKLTSAGSDPSSRRTESLTVIVRKACNGGATATGQDPCA
jgi:prepilin-type N-terminal cleavage/methylation domain-containing protein